MSDASRPGRNELCWCGSGRKYKRCHLESDRVGAPPPPGPAAVLARLPLLCREEEREALRRACRANAELMDEVRERVAPGARLMEIDAFVREWTKKRGHVPATLGYRGFPASCCTSVNEVVCHGIPDDATLREGDIVNVDLTTIVEGWHGDQSETFLVGEVGEKARAVTQASFDALWAAIAALEPFAPLSRVGEAIVAVAAPRGFSVVEVFQGHGIGRRFHQDPFVPHYPTPEAATIPVAPGLAFTIEPMINEGTPFCEVDPTDGWTARTADRKLSAQFEHTVLMTEEGLEVLTLTKQGPQRGHRF